MPNSSDDWITAAAQAVKAAVAAARRAGATLAYEEYEAIIRGEYERAHPPQIIDVSKIERVWGHTLAEWQRILRFARMHGYNLRKQGGESVMGKCERAADSPAPVDVEELKRSLHKYPNWGYTSRERQKEVFDQIDALAAAYRQAEAERDKFYRWYLDERAKDLHCDGLEQRATSAEARLKHVDDYCTHLEARLGRVRQWIISAKNCDERVRVDERLDRALREIGEGK